MHTNSRPAFARGDRLTPEDLNLGEESRRVWLTVTEDRRLRERLTKTPLRHTVYRVRRENERSDPLELISRFIVIAAACGYSESRIRLIITHLETVLAACYGGNAHRSLEELDLEESRLGTEQQVLTLRRLYAGDEITAEQLEHEAMLNLLDANVRRERAKELRRLARSAARVLLFERKYPRPEGFER